MLGVRPSGHGLRDLFGTRQAAPEAFLIDAILGQGGRVQAPAPIKKLSWTIPSILAARTTEDDGIVTRVVAPRARSRWCCLRQSARNSLLSDDWCSQGPSELLIQCCTAVGQVHPGACCSAGGLHKRVAPNGSVACGWSWVLRCGPRSATFSGVCWGQSGRGGSSIHRRLNSHQRRVAHCRSPPLLSLPLSSRDTDFSGVVL